MPTRRPSYYLPAPYDPELVAAVGYMAGDPQVVDVHVLDLHAAPTLSARHEVAVTDGSFAPVLAMLVGLGFISMSAVVSVVRHRGPVDELPQDQLDVRCLLYALRRDRRDLMEGQYDA